METVSVNGLRLLVDETGAGDPLVLVHGSWDDHRVWALVEPELRKSFRVLTYDRRGHGESEDSVRPGTRLDDEDGLAALLDASGLAPAHLVGNSFGGSIVLGVAERHPGVVRSVCAHEPPLFDLAPRAARVSELVGELGPVVSLIERGDPEGGARRFVDRVVGPGVWEEIPADSRATMIGHAQTFVGEVRDPGWASVDLDALSGLESPLLLTRGEGGPGAMHAVVERLVQEVGAPTS